MTTNKRIKLCTLKIFLSLSDTEFLQRNLVPASSGINKHTIDGKWGKDLQNHWRSAVLSLKLPCSASVYYLRVTDWDSEIHLGKRFDFWMPGWNLYLLTLKNINFQELVWAASAWAIKLVTSASTFFDVKQVRSFYLSRNKPKPSKASLMKLGALQFHHRKCCYCKFGLATKIASFSTL